MVDDKEYVERLEKIIDKQDDLLTQLDAKFQQQDTLNSALTNENKVLREDIKKHKDLLMDMNKTVNQHKNVVNKLKKELEEQLKIQQELHKDYGEIIKELTEELEEKENNNSEVNQNAENTSSNNSKKVELPPRENESNHIENASNIISNIKDKSSEMINENSQQNDGSKKCPKCGAEIKEGYIFCESCGTKLD